MPVRLTASRLCFAMLLVAAPYHAGCSDTGNMSAPPGNNMEGGEDSAAGMPGQDAGEDASVDGAPPDLDADATSVGNGDATLEEGGQDSGAVDSGSMSPDSGSPMDSGGPVDSGSVDSGSAMDSGGVDSGSDGGANQSDSGADSGIDASARLDGGADAGLDATSDAALDSGTDAPADTGADSGGGTGDAGSPCPANNGGPGCTPTEQKFVDKSPACYQCLVMGDCLNNTIQGDTGLECGDLTGSATAGEKAGSTYNDLCLSLLDCTLSTKCASTDITICYCGALGAGVACTTASSGANGACMQQEANGANHPSTDPPSAVTKDLNDKTKATGKLNQIYICGKQNNCDALCTN